MNLQNLSLHIWHKLDNELLRDRMPGHWRNQQPGHDNGPDRQASDSDRDGDGIRARRNDPVLEQQVTSNRIKNEHGRGHGLGTSGLENTETGFRKAQIRAIGHSSPPVAMPIQPAAVIASACGWPRFLAIWPGNFPRITMTTSAVTK